MSLDTIYTLEYKLVAPHTNFQLNRNLHVLHLTISSLILTSIIISFNVLSWPTFEVSSYSHKFKNHNGKKRKFIFTYNQIKDLVSFLWNNINQIKESAFFGTISNFQLIDKSKRNLIVSTCTAYQVHREFSSSLPLLTNNYITIKGEIWSAPK